jgi:hypothetical protein
LGEADLALLGGPVIAETSALSAVGNAANWLKYGPAAGRAFWSGTGAAFTASRVQMYGGSTLEMTRYGRVLSFLSGAAQRMGVNWSQVAPFWQAASQSFALGAEGPVMFFQGASVRPTSIWLEHELPILFGRGIPVVPGN